jgi:3-deoxy-D-manno-octulosonate 8-phosphate phosphatase KdsC-like HAD superfamily phosphatase
MITKEQSKAVYQRKKDNTMARRKRTSEQTMICKTLHRKLKIEHTNYIKLGDELR